MGDRHTDAVASVDDVPLCLGCGLMSHHVHPETPLCWECFKRRERWILTSELRSGQGVPISHA